MNAPKSLSAAERHWRLSRRAFLRGVGVTMALPWMESIPSWGAESTPAPGAADGAFPKRFAALFWGNGVNATHWWAKGAGADMELGRSLEPLTAFRSQLNFISGLFNRSAVGVGIHPGQTGNLLSGAVLQKGAVLRGGVSMDQALADAVGQETAQPSMVLGCEQPITGYHETNFSMAYSSHISWQSADSPVPMEVYPSLAFDSLFENRGSRRTLSILDRVKEDAANLSRRVGTEDRSKLEEFLTSVREVEVRVDKARTDKSRLDSLVRTNGPGAAFSMKRPDNGLPEDIREHMRLMCDIIALGFQTDKTRIATLLLCRDLSGLFYPFLGVRKSHHPASHEDLSDDFEKITRFYVGQLAYLATKLASMKEGDGTVLDHSCLLFLSNMWSGSKHDSSRLPIVTIGGLGGGLKTGRVLDFSGRADGERKACGLYLGIMDAMGVRLPRFGDATERLAGV